MLLGQRVYATTVCCYGLLLRSAARVDNVGCYSMLGIVRMMLRYAATVPDEGALYHEQDRLPVLWYLPARAQYRTPRSCIP
eukprot:695124-Rhodomonas_salina.2